MANPTLTSEGKKHAQPSPKHSLFHSAKTMEQKERQRKAQLGIDLLDSKQDIGVYVKGVCYDAVAFVRYLLNPALEKLFQTTSGNQWANILFQYTEVGPTVWKGEKIARGTAVGFYNMNSKKIFHAAISVGGTIVRGVNGFLLSPGWGVPADLAKVLGRPNEDGTFNYDNGKIRVFLSTM